MFYESISLKEVYIWTVHVINLKVVPHPNFCAANLFPRTFLLITTIKKRKLEILYVELNAAFSVAETSITLSNVGVCS
jgi:hypothetical protein